jgi:hypothetical protein
MTIGERLASTPLLGGKGSITGDVSTNCVLVWFVLAVLMLLVDFTGDENEEGMYE